MYDPTLSFANREELGQEPPDLPVKQKRLKKIKVG